MISSRFLFQSTIEERISSKAEIGESPKLRVILSGRDSSSPPGSDQLKGVMLWKMVLAGAK